MSSSRHLIATACRATSPEHAVVRIYETKAWQPVGSPLEGHSLTVTRIAFSPDDRFLLSVSRDRTWQLYSVQPNGGTLASSQTLGRIPHPFFIEYSRFAGDKSHGRIIWDCAWAHEGDIFATASRDKTVSHPLYSTLHSTDRWCRSGFGTRMKKPNGQ